MKKIILISAILISNLILFAQSFEQIVESWPSTSYQTTAPKRKVQHLNDDLEVVKEEYFDPNGLKVASYNIDPITKEFHGEFFDGSNKGYYNQGILTADNFKLVLSNPASEVVFNVKNGIIYGKLTKSVPWIGQSKIEYKIGKSPYRINNYIRYEKYINAEYTKYMRENNQKEPYFSTTKYELNYDENGLLHGTHYLDRFNTMYFENGNCTGILTYDGNTGYNEFDDNDNFIGVKGYSIDSVFRDQKIWKRNFKLIKNCGFIEAYTLPNLFNVGRFRLLTNAAYDHDRINSEKIFIGQEVFEGYKSTLTFFNSEYSVVPNHVETGIWDPSLTFENTGKHKKQYFLFEYRTASIDKYGFYVNEQSPVLSVFSVHKALESIDHFKMIFALQNLHCWISTYGLNNFDDINFYKKTINQFKDNEMVNCHGCRLDYWAERFGKSFWMDGSMGGSRECDIYDSIGYFNKTSYSVLNQIRNYIEMPKANELFVNVCFINKDLKEWSDGYATSNEIALYAIDEVIDFERMKNKNEEILQQFEKEKNELEFKINTLISSIDLELKNEQWKLLLPLSKKLDSLVNISFTNHYEIIFSDPREKLEKEKDIDFNSYVENQIKLQKIEADYTALKTGSEKFAKELNLEFTTNINVTGNTTDLFERLSTKESSVESYLEDIEKRIVRLNKVVDDYFSPTEKIKLDVSFADMDGDSGSLCYSLFVAVDKPRNDFIEDKKSLQQEWKSNSPKLMLQFSTNDINKLVFSFGNMVRSLDFDRLP